ncbi:hypothetical protein LLH03_07445 [bacterium]|nr:hypothetical protein [bacterium]
MFRRALLPFIVFLAVVACLPLGAQQASTAPRVSLRMDNKPVKEVAAELTRLFGVQVYVTDKTGATVSVDLKDVDLEQAVAALAQAGGDSWMRAYLIEKNPTTATYTADQLCALMAAFRREWTQGLTTDQRQGLLSRWRAAARAQTKAPQPGGAAAPRPAGAQDAQARRRQALTLDDPVGGLLLPLRTETISVDFRETPLKQALYKLMELSGFITLPEEGLEGPVGLELKDVKVGDAVNQVAEAVKAKVRVFYLIGQPRQMDAAEARQRVVQRLRANWQEFWAKTPEERQQEIQRRVASIDRLVAAADRAAANPGQPNRARQLLDRVVPPSLAALQRAMANLTPEQQQELMPLLNALTQAAGNQ